MNRPIASVQIAASVHAAIVAHAAAAHPHEACGLLLGDGRAITGGVAAANVAATPATAFEIDPATLLRIHREARGGGQAVAGWYHSHPNGSSAPSATDAARAEECDRLWLIVADGAVAAWRADGAHGFDPLALVVA